MQAHVCYRTVLAARLIVLWCNNFVIYLGVVQIKADVETQGEFVQSLAAEVRAAVYDNIEDVVAFVTWLDDELSFLVQFLNPLLWLCSFAFTTTATSSLPVIACVL